ncbi:MAG: asparagine synthase (glutamine-hydrolyzing), partial [Rhodospirillaceae bacterium]
MCGIAGILNLGGLRDGESVGRRMADALRHRGPDAGAVWEDAEAGLVLAHRRLSVVDLSPAGAQPMASASGRWVICYNGEVYNAIQLRQAVDQAGSVAWRGHSDTEVIVEHVDRFGVGATVSALIGMFAIALWDRAKRCLWLVRDRMGVKPLYWGQFGGRLLFGSELKALRACSGWTPRIDREAVTAFMRHSYIPAPRSIYHGIHKLLPGHMLRVAAGQTPVAEPYWTLRDNAVLAGRANTLSGLGDEEATDHLEYLLRDAVERRMVADVPLGAFLSGGIDSSLVAALMQAQSDRPVRTFSIGFGESEYNEAHHAKAVATHLGTDHTEVYVDSAQALGVIPLLGTMFDEPFADSSQLPTYLLSQITRQHVTVALSGDGGDELFAGYTRYALAGQLWSRLARIPRPLRALAAQGIHAVPPKNWQRLFNLMPESRRLWAAGDRLHKFADTLILPDQDALYRRLVSHWTRPEEVVRDGHEPTDGLFTDPAVRDLLPDSVARMQYLDTLTYLPDDILTKVDRTSMAVSLEV